jgi:peptidoglycan hydrolase-like protein with peptidoglycan-binding domain
MRRLWMSALLAPVLALAVPAVALATPSVPAARTAPAAAAGLQVGQHGLSVRALQRRLAALKYYPGAIDGNFGTDTLEAVWAFQEVQGCRVRTS